MCAWLRSDVISYSTADNQKMWQLGDCAEVFIKPEDGTRTDYWESEPAPRSPAPHRGNHQTTFLWFCGSVIECVACCPWWCVTHTAVVRGG